MIRRVTAAALLGVAAIAVSAAEPPLPRATPESVGLDAAKLEVAGNVLEQAVRDGRIAGAVAAVARDGKLAFLAAAGVQDVATRTPMSEASLFRIYSLTKPVTAVAAMTLVEAGRLDLDAPVSRYLPEFSKVVVEDGAGGSRPPSRVITVRDLLLHMSGLNHRTSPEYRQARVRARDISLTQFVENIVRVPLKEDPGTRFRYSESPTVVGRLIEIVSGERFDRFLDRHVLQPLGMRDTMFVVPPEARGRLTTVYRPVEGGRLEPVELETVPFTDTPALFEGAVGLVSTVPDYLRFAQMLLNGGTLDGTRVLRAETVARMVSNGLPPNVLATRRGGTGWGLGNVEVFLNPGSPDYPVGAGEYGWNGTSGPIFWVNPSRRMVTVLMLQSTDPFNPDRIWQRFRSAVEQAVKTE